MRSALIFAFILLGVFGALPPRAHAAALDACGESLTVPDGLDGNITLLCGLNMPEDFAATPDRTHIVVGDIGMENSGRGIRPPAHPIEMSIIDTRNDKINKIRRILDKGANWGDPSCPVRDPSGPFFALGINISARGPGITQLMVVNKLNGDRVEFYQLVGKGDQFVAAWRGCVQAPDEGTVDAVAPLPSGGFVASIICNKQFLDLDACIAAGTAGQNTGWLAEWNPDGAWRRLPGSEARLNNGIDTLANGRNLVVATTGSRQLRIYSLQDHKYTRSVDLPFAPDNVRISPGDLVIAGGTTAARLCLGKRSEGCRNEAWVMSWDLNTGRRELLFFAPEGLLTGTTGGVVVGDALYVSSLSDPFLLKTTIGR